MDFEQPPRARYGNCDSYFVESQEDGVYAARAEARERARAIAREQQRSLAEELSRMTSEEYQEDILDHMEHMEVSSWNHDNFLLYSYFIVPDITRRKFDRYPDRNTVVYAAISLRLPHRSPRRVPVTT